MILSLIVAIAENGVIGRDNRLPWHLPEDLRFFKQTTLGKPVIMGRKTFQSIGKPLPGRQNIVLSRDPGFTAAGITVKPDLNSALDSADADEAFIIGGANLFAEGLQRAQRLYITEVHRHYDGDVRFPEWDRTLWRETSRRRVEGDPDFSFVLYEPR